MKKINITEDVILSYSICQRKSYQLLFQYAEGEEQNYATFLRKRIDDIESYFFRSEKHFLPFASDKLKGKAEIILNATINAGNFVVKNIHLQKREISSKLGGFSYEPLMITASNKIKPEDRIVLSYIGYVLYKVQGVKPEKAVVILIEGSIKSIKLDKDVHFPIINELNEWIHSDSEIPPIPFNNYCSICPFEQSCLAIAEKEDSISLLGNMTLKVQKKFESKGIFTIKQLSYLYKPRRRSRLWGERKTDASI